MAKRYEEDKSGIESNTVGVYRTAATVKGGRRFSFSGMVVCGDRKGRVGLGYGKANQVPNAIEKAQKKAKQAMRSFPLTGTTIPHQVTGRFGACTVRLVPASPGTGVIAGAAVRAVLDLVGVQDCLSKAYGSTNNKNLTKAVIDGLRQLRSREQVENLRKITIEKTHIEEAHETAPELVAVDAEPKAEASE
ncbi:MAG: 30S ribosomal protein S5 [Phycisphaerae bacterium]|jgi:small subunit ribosomal protein S5|nr:30S ribosomal protein S5 [Opitutales bacterium]MBT4584195.1 30S ribosomal protein S5 [Phycisphaerae bacterium]|tara:strand:+ start:10193 stop:10765 length:573 start_codon:yes stop_codon:yes gene_type:complete